MTGDCLDRPELAQRTPLATPAPDPLGALRGLMQRTGQWQPGQMAGRRWPVACVALEVTQRCNLDCTLCYLSESSEAVRDLPMAEILRRIDLIHAHYGAGTDVQVTGGEPTLRAADELRAIVARIAALGMRATLFTNGIRASRALLADLAGAGLTDVAFHVDTTQRRAGYADEAALHALRRDYIERARGLPIGVFFNTTVHAGNFDAVPALADFFRAQADMVRMASFQLQAETGRGVLAQRPDAITHDSLMQRLEQGVGSELRRNVLMAGHHDCNRSVVMLVINGRVHDAFADGDFIQRFMRETATLRLDRGTPARALRSLLVAMLKRPRLIAAALRWAAALAWRARADLLAARGRVHKLTFFCHGFMDAGKLDRERIDACVFMAMTQHGPLSMCLYNAQRDRFLLESLPGQAEGWQPLRWRADGRGGMPIKLLKGRARQAALRSPGAHRADAP